MEIKKIFEKIRRQEEKEEYFFALQIEEGWVKSALWTIEKGTVRVLALGEKQSWEKEEDILPAVDASLPSFGEKEPSKIIFGINPEWIEENKVIPGKVETLKKICHELELSAVGFVVTPEAIVYHLKIVEGIPTTAILVFLGEKKINVTLVKLGKIVGIQIVNRSQDLGADLVEGLSRFSSQEALPPRIILYSQEENLEKERGQLMNFSWDNFEVNFLHLPKVEILPKNFDIYSVALAGGKEVGEAKEIKIEAEEFKFMGEKTKDKKLLKEDFIQQGELAEDEVGVEREIEEIKREPEPEETMGFVQGRDITQESSLKETERVSSMPVSRLPRKINFPKLNLKPVFGFFPKTFSRFLFSLFSQRVKLVVGIIIAFLIIFGGVFVFCWWYLPKAQVTLWVTPQILEKDFIVKLDPKLTAVDKENLVLPAEEMEVILTGEKKAPTTGEKLIGEPAKGEVTIYNRTNSEKAFEAGTQLIGPNNLKFSLDEEVIVASESAGSDYTRIPGKAKVKVTALAIGSEGNLASGTEFSIGSYSKSDFVAKNEEAFSGGTSREIQVVSKKDQEKLVEELIKELNERASLELQKGIASDKRMIEESITSKVVEKNFDKDIDEEAREIGLKLRVKFKALIFSEEEFQKLIEEEILKVVPEGFEYKPQEDEINFVLKDITKEGGAVFSAHFKTSLFPNLDLEAIRNSLVGKYPRIGETYLGTLPSVSSFEIKITPKFPPKLATFPRVPKNIKIEVKKK